MRKFLFGVLFIWTIAPAVADTECPPGYTLDGNLHDDYENFSIRYTTLEYIESTGTQYIDTGINNGQWECLAQSVAGTATNSQVLFMSNLGNTGWAGCSTKGVYDFAETSYSINDKHLYEYSPTVADSKLFVGNTVNFPYFGKVWYLKIRKMNTLVRNFIPAKRNGDGAIGMYDMVTNTFFENMGEDEFIAGPIVGYSFVDLDNVSCIACPVNTYKSNTGKNECTPCPVGTFSPIGSTSPDECMRILHIGDKIYPLNSTKKTSPALHIRDENGKIWYGNLYSSE